MTSLSPLNDSKNAEHGYLIGLGGKLQSESSQEDLPLLAISAVCDPPSETRSTSLAGFPPFLIDEIALNLRILTPRPIESIMDPHQQESLDVVLGVDQIGFDRGGQYNQ